MYFCSRVPFELPYIYQMQEVYFLEFRLPHLSLETASSPAAYTLLTLRALLSKARLTWCWGVGQTRLCLWRKDLHVKRQGASEKS